MLFRAASLFAVSLLAFGQDEPKPAPKTYALDPGTKIPLGLLNSVSTKHSVEGDRVYLETVFPIMSGGRIVIPVGSNVAGTVTSVKRPGRVKGRGELYVRFDSLILPNGVVRDFRARMGTMDGRAAESFDRKEGKITSEGNKTGDATTIAAGASTGAVVGSIAGAMGQGSRLGGAGIGAAAGATAGLIGVLLTRGPDAVLAKGSTVEMVLDRQIEFNDDDLAFTPGAVRVRETGTGPLPSRRGSATPGGRRVIPGVM
ncbi:MAG: TrbI/VirB10 family protein [Bryobacteraceae bacterium]|nr:TrbI/VirB10 family protein [Bryobacteraceae bacterium]